MKKAILQLEELTCPSCLVKIEKALNNIDGIDDSSINILFNSSKVNLNYNESTTSESEIKDAINKIGYDVLKIKSK